MPYVNLNLPEDQLFKATELSKRLQLNRSAYFRAAIEYYILKTERELLAEQIKQASEKCRDESIAVCQEFESFDQIQD